MSQTGLILVVVLVCVVSMATEAKRILLLSYPMKSHTNEMRSIGEELIRQGHEVYGALPPTYPGLEEMQSSTKVQYIIYKMAVPDLYTGFDADSVPSEAMEDYIKITFMEDLLYNVEPYFPASAPCINTLSDQDLFQKLSGLHFDLALIDGFMQSRCFYVLAYRLGIPYVTLVTQYEPWLQRNPALPSFVPFPVGTGDYGYTDRMTFWQRLYNTYILFKWSGYPGVEYLSDDLVTKYAPEVPAVTLNHLAHQSLLWLLNTDLLLDFARPQMPNMVEVGGLTTRPARGIPSELDEFVSGAEHGVIIVSFSSWGASLPNRMIKSFLEAFKKVPQRVVWANPHSELTDVPDHIKIMEWIPQNDLLGHNNTKLFITHCGANGQFEALYHAVPMVAMPMFGDQPYNAMRAERKGIATRLDLLTFTPADLVEAIKQTIDGDSQKKIQKLSKIFKSRPLTPVQRSVDWIGHILEHGGEHLHSYALDMPAYQYLMLDILAFVVAVFLGVSFLVCCLIRVVCFRGDSRKTKTE
ncbi:hypothetical protein CAPTEDRAFT_161256 [Capitella teleta]|uniref:UDP-glucuronosyltransferase n=1 Tax=Capitella teleta TaxID=283909 RepID=R7TRL2_CAPTE|nr:hypothetical protein CAPTEDRAFT_161256 [Capitella teleta]|eukprot:ELT96217.1 hypothetical protein CAPTEDRAFT_161256 [Capitella teleta]